MISVDDLIVELRSIRDALGQESSERPRPSRRRPAPAPTPYRVEANPLFDSGEWAIDDPRLWDEQKERTQRAIEDGGSQQTGIEALAWYVSFHDDQQKWGIYIPLSSLALVDDLYFGGLPIDRDRRLHIVWSALLAHEQMHFAVDDETLRAECPVYAINDLDDIGVVPGSFRLIQCIAEVMETAEFEELRVCQSPAVQRDWNRKKEEIGIRLPAPPRFEKLKNWKPPTWSLRLRNGHRVHLLQPDSGATAWRAVAIGNHKELGHG